MAKKQSKKDVAIINSPEMRELVDSSLQEMDTLYQQASKLDLKVEDVKAAVQAIYLQNLKMTDEPAVIAKKLLAEGLTRIELDKLRVKDTPDDKMLSRDFKDAVKMTETLVKLVKDMEPKEVRHRVQVDDDKMMFQVVDGVYDEK